MQYKRMPYTAPLLGDSSFAMLAVPLCLLPLALSNLSRESSLDGCHTASTAAGITCDEVKPVFSLVEFGIRRAAGLACNIFNCDQIRIATSGLSWFDIPMYLLRTFSIC